MSQPIPFSIDGRPLQLRALNGAEAYEIASQGHWLNLVPQTVEGEGRDWLWERFADLGDPLTLRSLWRITHGLSPLLFGVEWWSAMRLAGTRDQSWMGFEAWSIRNHFDASAPWVSPRRLTAALMTWLASSCEKDVEWQQLQMEIMQPPAYAVWLPADESENGGMDPATFHANAPHWALTGAKREETPEPAAGQAQSQQDKEGPEKGGEGAGRSALAWSEQPVMSMDDFAAQAKQWSAARRKDNEGSGAGAAHTPETG